MKSQQIDYYDWNNIQEYLCKAIGISPDNFRKYHNVVGGDYKDFWHVWLWMMDGKVYNDSYMPTYIPWLDEEDDNSYFINKLTKEFGEWALDIMPALDRLDKELGDDFIVIHYSW